MAAPSASPNVLAGPAPAQLRPLFRGFFGIMERWGVDNAQARSLLGQPAERTYFKWKKGQVGAVPMDTIRRIGYTQRNLEGPGDPLFGSAPGRRVGTPAEPVFWGTAAAGPHVRW